MTHSPKPLTDRTPSVFASLNCRGRVPRPFHP